MKQKAIIVLCFTNMLTLGILVDTSHNNAYIISEQNKQINQLAQYRISNNTLQDNIDIQNKYIATLQQENENLVNGQQDPLKLIEPLKQYNKTLYLQEYLSITQQSIYDDFDYKDIDLFAQVVEAEATSGDFDNKCNVASVVWNRLRDDKYKDTLNGVLTRPNQFSCVSDGRIHTVTVTEEDYQAIMYTYYICDTTNGCVAFDNVNGNTWSSEHLTAQFTDSIGHTFYK